MGQSHRTVGILDVCIYIYIGSYRVYWDCVYLLHVLSIYSRMIISYYDIYVYVWVNENMSLT